VVVSIHIVASAIARDPNVGAYIAALAAAALVGIEAIIALLVVAAIPVLVPFVRRGRLGEIAWTSMTKFLNLASATLLAISAGTALNSGALAAADAPRTPIAQAREALPDIFLIMLDAYPRPDTLVTQFGVDVRPWLDAMERRDFRVSSASRSNYNTTQLTLPSIFSYQDLLVQPGIDPEAPPDEQARALEHALNEARGLGDLHRAGYNIVTITSASDGTRLHSADVIVDTPAPTVFEVGLLHTPILRNVLPDVQRLWLGDLYRTSLTQTFSEITELAEPDVQPRFVFAHVFAPHPPFVFDAAGHAQDPAPCFPTACQLWDAGFSKGVLASQLRGFVEWTNARVLEAVDSIRAHAARPPVIVVFSDHGLRHQPDDRVESTSNLFLASTPGHEGLFPADTTPVNILPRLLNTYAGTTLPMASERIYWVDMQRIGIDGPIDVAPVQR
jgi:hypothetical protein